VIRNAGGVINAAYPDGSAYKYPKWRVIINKQEEEQCDGEYVYITLPM
jgi:hypothetical protein